MKKLLVLLLALFVLTSCVSEANPPADTTDAVTTTDAGTTGGDTTVGDPTSDAGTTAPVTKEPATTIYPNELLLFTDYEEYCFWVTTGGDLPERFSMDRSRDIPDNFVTYDMIRCFGPFHYASFTWDQTFLTYYYGFQDDLGNRFRMEILTYFDVSEWGWGEEHTLDAQYTRGTPVSAESNRDMRTNPEKNTLKIGDVQYTYHQTTGNLNRIRLLYNKMWCFDFYPDRGAGFTFDQYPTEGGDAFITALLNSNTAEAAVNQWIACLDEAVAE